VETTATEDSYTKTLTRFVAACIRSSRRSSQRCRLPLTEDQRKAATSLSRSLEKSPALIDPKNVPIPLLREVQAFFFDCVTKRSPEAEDQQFSCPVQCYIAAYSFNKDNTFKLPHDLTSLLANWQYLLRATALYEAKLAHSDEKSGSMASYVDMGYWIDGICSLPKFLTGGSVSTAKPTSTTKPHRCSMTFGSCNGSCQLWPTTRFWHQQQPGVPTCLWYRSGPIG
jgi:hypothetical protein